MGKSSKVSDILSYPLVVFVSFFIKILPRKTSLRLARMFGRLVYIFYAKRRSIGYANIKAAFCKKLTPHQIRVLTRRTFEHFMQTLFEIFMFSKLDKKNINEYVSCDTFDRIGSALKKGNGAIMLTAHFGNWELASLAGAMNGYPQDVLARQQKHMRLNDLLDSYRETYGRRVIKKGIATREIIKSLRANKVIAILSDQDGGPNGQLVNFFGRLASTPSGAAVFVLKLDSPVLLNFCIRRKDMSYRLMIETPLEVKKTDNPDVDTIKILQEFTTILESYITRYPSQWLWLHKRWKTTPSRRVLILSDTKAGHLNQSLAVAKQIKRAVFEKAESDERVKVLKKVASLAAHRSTMAVDLNIPPLPKGERGRVRGLGSSESPSSSSSPLWGEEDLEKPPLLSLNDLIYREKIIEVKYKSPAHKTLLAACSLFASSRCQGCMKCVKFCLTSASYKNIIASYGDIVISAGSSLAPVNRFLCQENRARGIVIMKPGILPISRFDLCIMPRHDNPPKKKNVLVTDGALNLIDNNDMHVGAIHELPLHGHSLSIGLLIGGDNKDFALTKRDLENVLDAVIKISSQTGAHVLATTSRRSSNMVENIVKNKLGAFNNCKSLVIANEKNIPGAVNNILALSDIIIVSGESISMVSEAVSSGKKVVVFKLESKQQCLELKHLKFLDNMKNKGFISLCKAQDIGGVIKDVLQDTKPAKKLEDNELVYDAVRRMV